MKVQHCLLLCGFTLNVAAAAPVADDTEWMHLGGTAESQQFSGLDQINASNVASLGLLRYTDLPIKEGLVGNPLIKDGIAFESTPRGGAIAVDLASGALRWNFQPTFDYSDSSAVSMWSSHVTRGLGMDDEHVYTADGCYLFAIDRLSGVQAWVAKICDPRREIGDNAAPRTGAGKIFIGVENIERGSGRGYAAAF